MNTVEIMQSGNNGYVNMCLCGTSILYFLAYFFTCELFIELYNVVFWVFALMTYVHLGKWESQLIHVTSWGENIFLKKTLELLSSFRLDKTTNLMFQFESQA